MRVSEATERAVTERSEPSAKRRALGAARALCAAALAGLLAGCAANSPENAALGINDPYEGLNRDFHAFNKGVDQFAVRPVAIGYDTVTPALVQFLLRNALSHLELPRDFAANLFSGEFEAAGVTLARFGVNTLVGAGGLLDPATDFELPKQDADFGKTFASWGADEGIYYEIPLLGPSTVRHTAGRIVDMAFSPTTYIAEPLVGPLTTAVRIVDFRAQNGELIDQVLYESEDSYTTTRNLYIQNRRAFENDGQVDLENAPDFDATAN